MGYCNVPSPTSPPSPSPIDLADVATHKKHGKTDRCVAKCYVEKEKECPSKCKNTHLPWHHSKILYTHIGIFGQFSLHLIHPDQCRQHWVFICGRCLVRYYAIDMHVLHICNTTPFKLYMFIIRCCNPWTKKWGYTSCRCVTRGRE